MSKKTKALKHAQRVRGRRKVKRRNPAFGHPIKLAAFPMDTDCMINATVDLMIMGMIRTSGLRDIVKKAILKAPPDFDAEGSTTVQRSFGGDSDGNL